MSKIQWITYNGRHIPLTEELKEKLKKKKEEQNNKRNKRDEEDTSNKENIIKEKEREEIRKKVDEIRKKDKTAERSLREEKKDGTVIGISDKEGVNSTKEDPRVTYSISEERLKNLNPEEKKAWDTIQSNFKKVDKLLDENTEIYKKKSSYGDFYKEKFEGSPISKRDITEKEDEEYLSEMSSKDRNKIKNNDKKMEQYKQESLEAAKVLEKNKSNKGSIERSQRKELSNTEKYELYQKAKSVSKLRTLSDIEQYYINHGYNKATALKMAKKEIKDRKRK